MVLQRTSMAPSLKSAYVACDGNQNKCRHCSTQLREWSYDAVFDSISQHHSNSIAFLDSLSLKPSCKSITLYVQIMVSQCCVLMTSYHSAFNTQLIFPDRKKEGNVNLRRSITMLANHISKIFRNSLCDQWRLGPKKLACG